MNKVRHFCYPQRLTLIKSNFYEADTTLNYLYHFLIINVFLRQDCCHDVSCTIEARTKRNSVLCTASVMGHLDCVKSLIEEYNEDFGERGTGM